MLLIFCTDLTAFCLAAIVDQLASFSIAARSSRSVACRSKISTV
jgi:hypothetical protein